jgi:hypothetical protein
MCQIGTHLVGLFDLCYAAPSFLIAALVSCVAFDLAVGLMAAWRAPHESFYPEHYNTRRAFDSAPRFCGSLRRNRDALSRYNKMRLGR